MKDKLLALIAELSGSGILYCEAVREFKKRYIEHVLRQNKGNQCRAARELGMHRNTLSRTIMELKINLAAIRQETQLPARRRPQKAVSMAAISSNVHPASA